MQQDMLYESRGILCNGGEKGKEEEDLEGAEVHLCGREQQEPA